MSQTATPPPANPTAPSRSIRGRRCFVIDANWDIYTRLLRVYESKPRHRLAYDRGRLEIMAPSLRHDDGGEILGLLVFTLARELRLLLKAGGGVTLRSKKKQKGIEGDKSYWVANPAAPAVDHEFDLRIHPPPDLSIEVDVSRSSLKRFDIYAALGVPEVWRLDGDTLYFYGLGADKMYAEMPTSRAFPSVAPADLIPFVLRARSSNDLVAIVDDFTAWVRERVAAPPAS